MAASFISSQQTLDKPDSSLSQRLVSDNQQQKERKYPSFLLKGALVAIAISLLPLFPSEPPEFTNHTIFTRGWELLRLAVIGVALSYGLFSRRRAESEKEIRARIDSTQSYVAKILQVSPVFENDNDRQPYSDTSNNKVQSWSSLYSPTEPMMMVTDEVRGRHEKPFFLPVRSLRSGLPDAETTAFVQRVPENPSAKARNAESIRNAKIEIGVTNLDGDSAESVVLPSPIPWRSRSGRFELKEDSGRPPLSNMPPAVSETELQRLKNSAVRSSVPWSSLPASSVTPSPSISPSHSVSPTRRHASAPKFPSSNSLPTHVSATIDGVPSSSANEFSTENNILPRNLYHAESFEGSPVVKSVRTIRKSESSSSMRDGEDGHGREEKRDRRSRRESESTKVEISERKKQDSEYVIVDKPEVPNKGVKIEGEGIPVRKSRGPEPPVADKTERKSRETEACVVETNQRKSTFQPPPPPPPIELYEWYQRNWRRAKEKLDELKAGVDDASNTDDEEDDGDGDQEEVEEQRKDHVNKHVDTKAVESKRETETDSDANVDKKADEFIAKFRDQIRLQRIESIKRASGQTRNRDLFPLKDIHSLMK